MKTLADFKRALTVGSKWETKHVKYGTSMGIRPVSKITSNAVFFKTVDSEGKTSESRLDFPSARDIKFLEDGTVEIWRNGDPVVGDPPYCMLTYKKVED